MLEDFRLKIFLTLVSEGNFTLAALRLHITQPSVSQNISELEKTVGAKLFDRQKSGVILTPAGHIFKKYAESISSQYEQMSHLFLPLEAFCINISASEEVFDYVKNVLLADFLKVHENITLERTGEESAHIRIALVPQQNNRGTFALSSNPSEIFSTTALWRVVSDLLSR